MRRFGFLLLLAACALIIMCRAEDNPEKAPKNNMVDAPPPDEQSNDDGPPKARAIRYGTADFKAAMAKLRQWKADHSASDRRDRRGGGRRSDL